MPQEPYETPIKTQYVSLDEFKQNFGMDLEQILGGKDQALAFMNRWENRIETLIINLGGTQPSTVYPNFSDYQKNEYKWALMEEYAYILNIGDIALDNGYDQGAGKKNVSDQQLKGMYLSNMCKAHLINCGILCGKNRLGNRGITLGNWLLK